MAKLTKRKAPKGPYLFLQRLRFLCFGDLGPQELGNQGIPLIFTCQG